MDSKPPTGIKIIERTHCAYPNYSDEGYQARCWDCSFVGRLHDDKDVARAEAGEHEAVQGKVYEVPEQQFLAAVAPEAEASLAQALDLIARIRNAEAILGFDLEVTMDEFLAAHGRLSSTQADRGVS